MRVEEPGQRSGRSRPPASSAAAFVASVNSAIAPREKNGRLGGQRPGPLVVGRQLARRDLAGLDVGLVERVDRRGSRRPRPSRSPSGRIPVPRSYSSSSAMRTTGWPARSSASTRGPVPRPAPIAVADRRRGGRCRRRRADAERLAVDRDHALAVLAGGLGDQLLQPGAERGDARRRDDRELVAAEPARGDAEDRARARRPGSPRPGPTACRRDTISSVRSRNFATSMPMIAAGTSPKSDSTE